MTRNVPASRAEEREARLAWWREARLGLFIHWGLYSLAAGRWNAEDVEASYAEHIQLRGRIPVAEYGRLADRFAAEAFDAREWARLAKQAGMRYIVFTAKHHDGFAMYHSRVGRPPLGDYRNTFDNQPLVGTADSDWEGLMTLNDSWGYKPSDTHWKRPLDIIQRIVYSVSKNGNLLMNVGPAGDGCCGEESVQIMGEVGRWLGTHGASIYGAGAAGIGPVPWGWATYKAGTLYAHIATWPADGALIVPGVMEPVSRAYRIDDPLQRPLAKQRRDRQDWVVHLSGEPHSSGITVVALELAMKRSGKPGIHPLRLLFPHAVNAFSVFDGKLEGSRIRLDSGKLNRDNVLDWTCPGDGVSWEFRAEQEGLYRLLLEYGASDEQAGGRYRVRLDETEWESAVQASGGPYVPRQDEIAVVSVRRGRHRLEIRFLATVAPPAAAAEGLMQLTKLILMPVKDPGN